MGLTGHSGGTYPVQLTQPDDTESDQPASDVPVGILDEPAETGEVETLKAAIVATPARVDKAVKADKPANHK